MACSERAGIPVAEDAYCALHHASACRQCGSPCQALCGCVWCDDCGVWHRDLRECQWIYISAGDGDWTFYVDSETKEIYCPCCEEATEILMPTGVTPTCPGCAETWWKDIYPSLLRDIVCP